MERLEKIGKQLDLESDTTEEEHELDSNDENPEESREAKEYNTKIFALKNKVAKRLLSSKSLKNNYMQGLVKYQINDPNTSVQQIEALIHDQKIHSTIDNIAFLPDTEFKKLRSEHLSRSPLDKLTKKRRR